MLYTLKKATEEAIAEIEEEKRVRGVSEIFLLFALDSQFDHLIKQEMDKLGVFCLVADPATVRSDDVLRVKPRGIILSGGPVSVYDTPPPFDNDIFDLGIPVLGICLGFQLIAQHLGIEVLAASKREFSTHQLAFTIDSLLFVDCPKKMKVLQSHGDIVTYDSRLKVLAETENTPIAAANYDHLWGVQFHPEVTETEYGAQIFENFCFKICEAKDRFPAEKVAERKIEELKIKIGADKVLLALSGGSDSSTVAYLLKNALAGKSGQVKGVYIKGIDRPDDEKFVWKYFGHENWLELEIIDATDDFLLAVAGIPDMHSKRLAMRGIYKRKLEEAARRYGARYIAQGTLYTDISESGGGYDSGAKKAQIKLHHNVNLEFDFEEILPLADCVKDSGRNIGRIIGVPEEILKKHPFPGPGLLLRIEGAADTENLAIARQADKIYIEELRKWELYDSVWQAGPVVTQSVTTCTKGDDAAIGAVVALWAVWSVNGFTARAAELPWEFIKHVSRRITNEIREVGAVVYRVTDKPPATIEWG